MRPGASPDQAAPQAVHRQPMMPEDPANLVGQSYQGPATVTFSQSFPCLWVKGKVSCDRLAIQANLRDTVLNGILPAGHRNQRIPMANVSAVRCDTECDIGALAIAAASALFALLTLAMGGDMLMGVLFFAPLAVCSFANGIKTQPVIQRAGSDLAIEFPFFERAQALTLNRAIQDLVELREAETNNNLTTYAQANALLQSNTAETGRLLRGLQQMAR